MRLLLDIGNSRIKWAVADGPMLRGGGTFPHGGDPAGAIGDADLPRGHDVWICHVTGADHEHGIATAFDKPPQFSRTQAEFDGLRVAYADPRRLGVDRWLCMVALWSHHRAACCAVSAGTALTFDAIDARGQHLGGVIAPGLSAMQSAVLGTTRFRVDEVSERYDDGLGRDSESCVRQGALHAAAGLIDRLGTRHAGARAITGGDAEVLQPLLATRWELRPQLVLEGLAIVAAAG